MRHDFCYHVREKPTQSQADLGLVKIYYTFVVSKQRDNCIRRNIKICSAYESILQE